MAQISAASFRLGLGVAMLVIGFLLPLGSVLVVQTDWSAPVKSLLSGLLFFGFEILAIPAVAIMGKENFDRIMAPIRRLMGRVRLSHDVGPMRHAVGVTLFFVSFLPAYIMGYLPWLLPDVSSQRLWVNLLADAVFLISLVVLGGDFWDKLRALFQRSIAPGNK